MAKKKKTTSGRAAKKRATKKVAKKKPAKKKAAKKKTAKKKATPRKTAKARSSSPGKKSVDGLLKKYEREQSAKEAQLSTLVIKIEDLEAKSRVFQEQIAKLTVQKEATEEAIAQLGSRRDEEIGKLLSNLGVQLGGGSSVSVADEAIIDEEDSDKTDPASDDDSDNLDLDALLGSDDSDSNSSADTEEDSDIDSDVDSDVDSED
jgi:hypothetical protein